MADQPEDNKPDFESWFIGGEHKPLEEQPTVLPTAPPPAPPPPPEAILTPKDSKERIWETVETGPKQSSSHPAPELPPIPPPPPPPEPSGWVRNALLAVALLAFGGAGAYFFYPRPVVNDVVINKVDPPPVTPPVEPPPPVTPPVTPPVEPPPPVRPPVTPPVKPPTTPPVTPPPVMPPITPPVEPPPPVTPPVTPPVEPPPPVRKRLSPDPSLIVRPPPSPPPSQPPPPTYSGPASGVINWSGRLDKNGSLVIEGAATQSGTVNGALPGVPVMIDIDTKEFAIAEAPSPSNGWKRLKIRSRRKTHSVVTIRWTVMQQ